MWLYEKNDVNKAFMLLYEKYCSFIFYHISLLISHFNEWNTPQTKNLSGALIQATNEPWQTILSTSVAFYFIQEAQGLTLNP